MRAPQPPTLPDAGIDMMHSPGRRIVILGREDVGLWIASDRLARRCLLNYLGGRLLTSTSLRAISTDRTRLQGSKDHFVCSIFRDVSQVLSPPALRSAVLFTPEGQLVSYASDDCTAKDEIRVIVGLSSEIWRETRDLGVGMVDSELGRLLVLPIDDIPREPDEPPEKEDDPLMLLVLNSDNTIGWKALDSKARQLAKHLERPVAELRGRLGTAPASPIAQRPTAR